MPLENTAGRGVLSHYGTRAVLETYGGETAGEDGLERVLEYVFNSDELPAYGATNLEAVIPAGARITEAAFSVITAFTSTSGTTDLDVGLWQNDNGGTYDLDGLHTAVQLTQAVIGTLVTTLGTGNAVNGVPLTEAVQVYVTPNVADLTAGRAKLVVKYTLKPEEG